MVGLGEVGRVLFEPLREGRGFMVCGLDLDKEGMDEVGQNLDHLLREVDVMYICVLGAYREEFADIVAGYVEGFEPKPAIINSTAQSKTTKEVQGRCRDCLAAFSHPWGTEKIGTCEMEVETLIEIVLADTTNPWH